MDNNTKLLYNYEKLFLFREVSEVEKFFKGRFHYNRYISYTPDTNRKCETIKVLISGLKCEVLFYFEYNYNDNEYQCVKVSIW